MPREIADSDDELDFIPRPKPMKINVSEHVAISGDAFSEDQLDPVLGTDFDQFLSPTQRLSSYDGNHESPNDISTSKFLDSSTNRFLEAVAPSSDSQSQKIAYATAGSQSADSDMGGKRSKDKASSNSPVDKKRSRALMEDIEERHATKKKPKTTYGSSATSTTRSKDASEFAAMMDGSRESVTDGHQSSRGLNNDIAAHPAEMISVEARTEYTSPLDLSLHLSPTDGAQMTGGGNATTENVEAAGAYVPRRPYQPNDHYLGSDLRGVTRSNSSMGNYQSFSINPENLGMDFDKINPFGSLSQVSLSGDLDSEETRGIADIFRNSASYSTKVSSAKETESSRDMLPGIEHEMQTSPIKGNDHQQTAENEAQCSPPFSQITNPEEQGIGQDVSISRQRRDQELAAAVNVAVAKPAPKKRGRKPKNSKKVDILEADANDVDELHADEQPLDRAMRAGTTDSVSNVSEVSQATNSSQRGKKRKLKKSDMAPPEVQSKKLPSSDLGLDNKAIIGLSPERYVPRPSRRRGQIESPVPDPDELNTDLADEQAAPQGEVFSKPLPAKGKKGKKGKGKGNKASTTAPAKQQHDLNEDGTEDRVEEGGIRNLSSTNNTSQSLPNGGQEQMTKDETIDGEEDEDQDENITKGGHRRTKISVDIPIFTKPDDHEDLPPPVAEPKKRGRKKKKPVEEAIVESDDKETTRAVLSEKDVNIQIALEKHDPDELSKEGNTLEETAESKLGEKDEENEQTPARQTKATLIDTPSKLISAPNTGVKPLSSTPLFNARARIGLSKRHSIPSLLRKVDRNKEAPKNIERKEKVTKRVLEEREQERIAREEAEAEGREYKPLDQLRDKDGRLVEWDF